MVVVDLGIDSEGKRVGEPYVEFNRIVSLETLKDEGAYQDGKRLVELSIPRITADREKKMYLLVNAEPSLQPYLDLRLESGEKVERLDGDEDIYIPDSDGVSPFDKAIFTSPIGSYLNNNIEGELLVPMTAIHEFVVPTIDEIEEKYPTVNAMLTYPLPGQLMVVKAMNKIWFSFINKTASNPGYPALDLKITSCSISEINHGDSYLFGRPGTNGNLFSKYKSDGKNEINKPWMQWLNAEATRAQAGSYSPQWLKEYDMPEGAENKVLTFYPGSSDEGLILQAPTQSGVTNITTKALPVYFPESHTGITPQQYEMTFTVEQREKGSTEWGNEFTYSIMSSVDSSDASSFHLLSLFRNTEVEMEVSFKTGRSGIEMTAEVYPYGNVILNPGFGL